MSHTPQMAIPLPHRARGRKGPPIVLIHGFGGEQLSWASLMTPLSKLRRTIALDLPGHGEAVDWPETPDASTCAKAVIETLDALGLATATLVGHSLGGAVASLVGLKRPDLVERLILLAPGGFGPEMNVRLLRRYAHAVDEATMALVLEGFFGPTHPLPEALARLGAQQRSNVALSASFKRMVEVITKGDGQGVLPLDDLAASPFPISLIWGSDDQVLPVRQALAAPPAIARHILPGAGHMPHLEATELMVEIIGKTIDGRYLPAPAT